MKLDRLFAYYSREMALRLASMGTEEAGWAEIYVTKLREDEDDKKDKA